MAARDYAPNDSTTAGGNTWTTADILFTGALWFHPTVSDNISGLDGAAYHHYIFDDLGRLVERLYPPDGT